ncbi:MAG: polysaccharide deacetylase [Magnetovibrio sp.]|nr:polysaccharide deacetylase [Magnetovibrio sp.]
MLIPSIWVRPRGNNQEAGCFMSDLTIFLYHGVSDAESPGIENFSGKHIHIDTFRDQISTAKRIGIPLSMEEVRYHVCERRPFPPRAFAVTFDDGFENNHAVAAPVLDDFDVPAMFYFSTGFVESDRMFWVDEIEDCINRSEINEIDLSSADSRLPNSFPLQSDDDRIHATIKIKGVCKEAIAADKERILAALKLETAVTPSVDAAANYRKISWAQTQELDSHPLFEIGGHSHDHNILSRLSVEGMHKDVDRCMSLLEKNLGRTITHFSYPEGRHTDYNEQVISHLKHWGIVCCPSAEDGRNDEQSDLFHLRRTMVGFMGTAFPWTV